FLFNDMSNTIFLQEFVRVYRKAEVRIEAKLYDLYQSLGLFDATHTIGTPYHGEWTPTDKKYKVIKVQMFESSNGKCYRVIRAMPPAEWNACTEPSDFTDITKAGFLTTLGPASFYESMLNKLDVDQLKKLPKKCGHPPLVTLI
ncbi:hypothetical protein K438DRAFT_1532437, partial [Mycena galopus ATCC 62051]